jgi:hypothetical protein
MVVAPAGGIVMNGESMRSMLNPLRARIAGWLALRIALTALAVFGSLILAAVFCDAALDLPETWRAIAPWALGIAVALILGAGIWEWRRLTEARLARLFERANVSLGNRLINAVQLAQKPGGSAAEEYLRLEAVRLGRETANNLRVWPVMRRNIRRAGLFFCGALLAWAVLLLAENELVRAVLPRFLDPRGDHPPFSRLKIAVTPAHAEVLFGGTVEVRAITSGRPVEKLWLVAQSGTNVSRAIMFLASDKSFFQSLANLREATEYFVTDGAARSRRFPIQIRFTPQITLVEVAAKYPDYTGKPPHSGKLSEEAQALPEETRVSFRVASNRPLKTGSLDLTPVLGGKPVQVMLQPEQQNTVVTGSFTLTQPVVFNLSVRDVDGLDCAEPRRGRFNILPDARPQLFVLEPGRDAVATPNIRIPVRVQASDDYAVSRVMWLRGFNRSVERPFNMKMTIKGGAQSVECAGAFELDKLGVRPGDAIEYYFEAADNYPKGPNVVFSRPFRLEIISEEQYQAILRQAAARQALFEPYFKLDAWLRRLAERSRGLESKAGQSDPTARDEAAALDKELEKLQAELGKLLQSPMLFDVEQSFRTALVAQHTRLEQTSAKLKQALAAGQLDPKQLKEISDELEQLAQTQDEQVEQPAQQIAEVVRVLARADTFVQLAQQQATLAQMLRRFSDRTNALSRMEQMEVQELAHQQHRLREALQTLLTQLPELLAQVPADHEFDPLRRDLNGFLQAVAEAKIEGDLNAAAIALDEPDTMTGHGLAQMAAEKMDRLIAKCSGLQQQGQECLTARFQPKLSKPGIGNTVQQILAALGAGNGENGRDGYALFNEAVALYGPNVELAGEQAGRRGDVGRGEGRRSEYVTGDARDAGLPAQEAAGRVHLQTDAKFPLRYRDIVGEYFRSVAESQEEGAKR